MENQTPKVFISYAWEGQTHQDRALAFAERLEQLGVEVIFDQFEPNPPNGWPKWMNHAIEDSDFVLSLCTEKYYLRVNEQQPAGEGLGVQWEGTLIFSYLYHKLEKRNKFQVIQFDNEVIGNIPEPLLGNNRYILSNFSLDDRNFEALYRVLTNQPNAIRPPRGEIVRLQSRERTTVPRSGQNRLSGAISMPSESEPLSDSSVHSTTYKFQKSHRGSGSFLQRQALMIATNASEACSDQNYLLAIELAKRALKLNGQLIGPFKTLSNATFALGNFQDCIGYSAKLLAKFPEDLDTRFIYLESKYHESPSSNLDTIMQEIVSTYNLNRDNPDAINGYCHFLTSIGDYDSALQIASKSYDQNAGRFILTILSYCLWKTNQTGKALEVLEAADKNYFTAPNWINLGVARAELGRFGLGIEAINRGLRIRPNYQFGKYALAEIYALMNDVEACLLVLGELADIKSVLIKRVISEPAFYQIHEDSQFKSFVEEMRTRQLIS